MLNILSIDNSEGDVELIMAEPIRLGYQINASRFEIVKDMQTALDNQR